MKVAEGFQRASAESLGRPLTEKEKKGPNKFVERFLLLLNDTEE